jgi:hypothetical protein
MVSAAPVDPEFQMFFDPELIFASPVDVQLCLVL